MLVYVSMPADYLTRFVRLPKREAIVMAYLLTNRDTKKYSLLTHFSTINTIAGETGLNVKSVRNAITELTKRGEISSRQSRKALNIATNKVEMEYRWQTPIHTSAVINAKEQLRKKDAERQRKREEKEQAKDEKPIDTNITELTDGSVYYISYNYRRADGKIEKRRTAMQTWQVVPDEDIPEKVLEHFRVSDNKEAVDNVVNSLIS